MGSGKKRLTAFIVSAVVVGAVAAWIVWKWAAVSPNAPVIAMSVDTAWHAELGLSTSTYETALARVNAWLGDDVKKGVYVTALYALVDPAGGRAAVVCAGHKVPLLRYAADDGTLRTIQPDGIALGLDRGPVFERRLEVVEIPLDVGDRLFLCNSGPLLLQSPDGRELGEKAFFGRILKHSQLESLAFLKALRRDLEQFAGEDGLPHDISLVTISRSK